MPWLIDADCSGCDFKVRELFVMQRPARLRHFDCPGSGEMEEVIVPRSRDRAQWSDRDAVVVFKNADGTFQYPAVNSKETPPGCERVVIRDMASLRRFEREAGVVSHVAHFDQGSGRSYDGH